MKLCFQSAVFSVSVQCSEVSVQSSVFSMQFKYHVTHTVFSGQCSVVSAQFSLLCVENIMSRGMPI